MMRPDLDDYEEVSDLPELDNSRSRAMSWLVLGVAVAGFGALAYYAYHSGTQSVHSGDVLVVDADKTPIKESPANPEGEQFANKDKTIYDVIAGDRPEKKVEKLLPDAEHLTAVKVDEKEGYEEADVGSAPAHPPATTTFVNKEVDAPKAADKPDAVKKEAAPAKADVKAEVKPVAKPAEVVKHADEKPVKKELAEQTPSADAPKMINEKPAVEKKEPAKPVEVAAVPVSEKPVKVEVAAPAKTEAAPAPKPVVKAAEPAAASGPYKIQLGAFQSEEEARGQWKKITAKFGSIIKGAPIVVLAELDNGTYYRLRAGGFASADAAKQACAALTAKSQACFPVGK